MPDKSSASGCRSALVGCVNPSRRLSPRESSIPVSFGHPRGHGGVFSGDPSAPIRASKNRESGSRAIPRAQPRGLPRRKGKGRAPERNEAFVNSSGAMFCSALKMAPQRIPDSNNCSRGAEKSRG
jgi:hypothetical protein